MEELSSFQSSGLGLTLLSFPSEGSVPRSRCGIDGIWDGDHRDSRSWHLPVPSCPQQLPFLTVLFPGGLPSQHSLTDTFLWASGSQENIPRPFEVLVHLHFKKSSLPVPSTLQDQVESAINHISACVWHSTSQGSFLSPTPEKSPKPKLFILFLLIFFMFGCLVGVCELSNCSDFVLCWFFLPHFCFRKT